MDKEKAEITVSHRGDMFQSGSIMSRDIKELFVNRDTSKGKNLIEVKVNGELIFSFDSNFKGKYIMENGIQKPYEYNPNSQYKDLLNEEEIVKLINESPNDIII